MNKVLSDAVADVMNHTVSCVVIYLDMMYWMNVFNVLRKIIQVFWNMKSNLKFLIYKFKTLRN